MTQAKHTFIENRNGLNITLFFPFF